MELLLETHGVVTDTVSGMGELLDALGHQQHLGVCLDTGNSWLGGAEPLDYIAAFGPRIKHVHWKDMGPEWIERRGTLFGCGMATIALGDGVIDLRAIIQALKAVGFDGATTLEIAGPERSPLVGALGMEQRECVITMGNTAEHLQGHDTGSKRHHWAGHRVLMVAGGSDD